MDMRPYIQGILGLFFILVGVFLGPSFAFTGPGTATLMAPGSGGMLTGLLAPGAITWLADVLVISGAVLAYRGKPIPKVLGIREYHNALVTNGSVVKDSDAKRSIQPHS